MGVAHRIRRALLENFRHRHVQALWAFLAAQMGIYAVVYLVTPWNVSKLMNETTDRVFIPPTLLAILLIGYHWASAKADASVGKVEQV